MEIRRKVRYGLPLIAGFACLIVALFASPIVGWILFVVAFGLILDGVTAMWERAGGSGNMTTYRQ